MKLSVNSEETTAFRVSIDMTDKEKVSLYRILARVQSKPKH